MHELFPGRRRDANPKSKPEPTIASSTTADPLEPQPTLTDGTANNSSHRGNYTGMPTTRHCAELVVCRSSNAQRRTHVRVTQILIDNIRDGTYDLTYDALLCQQLPGPGKEAHDTAEHVRRDVSSALGKCESGANKELGEIQTYLEKCKNRRAIILGKEKIVLDQLKKTEERILKEGLAAGHTPSAGQAMHARDTTASNVSQYNGTSHASTGAVPQSERFSERRLDRRASQFGSSCEGQADAKWGQFQDCQENLRDSMIRIKDTLDQLMTLQETKLGVDYPQRQTRSVVEPQGVSSFAFSSIAGSNSSDINSPHLHEANVAKRDGSHTDRRMANAQVVISFWEDSHKEYYEDLLDTTQRLIKRGWQLYDALEADVKNRKAMTASTVTITRTMLASVIKKPAAVTQCSKDTVTEVITRTVQGSSHIAETSTKDGNAPVPIQSKVLGTHYHNMTSSIKPSKPTDTQPTSAEDPDTATAHQEKAQAKASSTSSPSVASQNSTRADHTVTVVSVSVSTLTPASIRPESTEDAESTFFTLLPEPTTSSLSTSQQTALSTSALPQATSAPSLPAEAAQSSGVQAPKAHVISSSMYGTGTLLVWMGPASTSA
ncbi:hypothetical protein CLAFUW4_13498 [Fulvia fulva]|uniref:Uncharacterized protein n=1 Tax=Passalora fulva TaxID=5499 RepID=A0A9Q8PJX2_PASFU|nr:uncharacterized protein CLAFUR5_13350 [Fulvia fulva]KAK4611759.1 hypothetical protein CLAFUR4_13501 [Fulvia fulva]KAK4613124.1 hypothetical protein CLAFUR0_13509 [Fulvia fulva]UJO23850.1 hypothetical protein CLAFUR5_13350 [Fulvia fulva]WPV21116.1 hypothetical protein CLAFUW4_13498 [Fulvia fulva]WPV36049.1 hypothetical protein CLAFUW7_13505 [Fulvia fulva]